MIVCSGYMRNRISLVVRLFSSNVYKSPDNADVAKTQRGNSMFTPIYIFQVFKRKYLSRKHAPP